MQRRGEFTDNALSVSRCRYEPLGRSECWATDGECNSRSGAFPQLRNKWRTATDEYSSRWSRGFPQLGNKWRAVTDEEFGSRSGAFPQAANKWRAASNCFQFMCTRVRALPVWLGKDIVCRGRHQVFFYFMIWYSHGGKYKCYCLLVCDGMSRKIYHCLGETHCLHLEGKILKCLCLIQ
jgi:hypothetical protein